MDNIQKKLLDMRDEIYDLSHNTNDDDFKKLMQLKDINEDLHETLILMHTNYKSNMMALKHGQITLITKLINYQLEIINKNKEVFKELENLKNNPSNTSSLLLPKNIVIVLGSLLVFIGALWFMFKSDSGAGNLVIEVLKNIIPKF